PVIVLFTKFDALYDLAYSELKSKGASMEEAEALAPKHAEESFAKGSQLKFLYHSKDIRRPPKCHVCLPNMDNDDANCVPLIERTAGTLDSEVLTQLFVSTQQTKMELCMKYAVEKTLPKVFDYGETTASEDHQMIIIGKLSKWFPHLWGVSVSILVRARAMLIHVIARCSQVEVSVLVLHRARVLITTETARPLTDRSAVIIFEHSFYIHDKRRHLQDQKKSAPSYIVALELYMASPHVATVREAVRAAVQAYEETMKAPVHTYKGNLPAWMAKLLFERSEEKKQKSMAKARLIKTVLEITLEHRLRMFNYHVVAAITLICSSSARP
ncbi:hypothetical protein P692DRAFT_20836132, partial [Suillus brevipes Sb2]